MRNGEKPKIDTGAHPDQEVKFAVTTLKQAVAQIQPLEMPAGSKLLP